MRKMKNKAGFSLIEMLVALLIMVFLIMGMGVGMDTGSRIYRDASFESDSATLAGILNTSLGDILRYSIDVKENTEDPATALKDVSGTVYTKEEVPFVFTSLDYGIQDAYFHIPLNVADGTSSGVLQMKNLRTNIAVELVNSGAYPDLLVSEFNISYKPRQNPGIEGGYFTITYKITSASDPDKVREVESIVRLMND